MAFRRKQIVVLSLVLMIVVAGYLQYSFKKNSSEVSGKDSGKLGEAVYVDNKVIGSDEQKTAKISKESIGNESSKDNKAQKAVVASKETNDFFTQAKMDRQISRSKSKDALKVITEDVNASKDIKNKAYDQMMKIVQNSEKEMKVEALLKEKGFSDVVALFGDDGSIDIVIKAPNLSSAQTVQITDVVTRQANLDVGKLHIRNIF